MFIPYWTFKMGPNFIWSPSAMLTWLLIAETVHSLPAPPVSSAEEPSTTSFKTQYPPIYHGLIQHAPETQGVGTLFQLS